MRVLQIFISRDHNFVGHHGQPPGQSVSEEVPEVECVAGRGLRGDRFFDHKDDYKGQVTFFSREVYDDLCTRFEVTDRGPEVLRRNIIVEDVDLNDLIGQEFEVQGVRFRGAEECSPCHWMNTAFHEGAHEALKGRGGLRARILSDGVLKAEAVTP